MSSEQLFALAELLRGQLDPTALPQEEQRELWLRGVLAKLEATVQRQESGAESLTAIALLEEAASTQESSELRQQAVQILLRLAQDGHLDAIDALYHLTIEQQNLAARQAILTQGWQPGDPSLRALFDWFSHLQDGTPFPEEAFPQITQAYFTSASPALQRRLLATAAQVHAENWAWIIQTIQAMQAGSQAELSELIERYPSLRPIERALLLDQLRALAEQGSAPAITVLGWLFINYAEPRAQDIILENQFLPDDPEECALFLFLSEQWVAYDELDFDHSLLYSAYENGGRPLRHRLLEHSRHTGRMEWMHGLSLSSSTRWLSDLSDADWDLSIRRLVENGQYPDLWRLAQMAPPVWSAAILARLAQSNWKPQNADEQTEFLTLAALAQDCLATPLTIQPKKALHSSVPDLTCLALHPSGRILAAGCSDSRIFQWALPDGDLRAGEIVGPAPVTRALAYSPDGAILAAASGDNRIRAFQLSGGQLLKTFEGHQAMIRALAISPDGHTLYSASFDGTLRFWRFPYGPELKTLRPGSGEVFSMVLGANSKYLMSGGSDNLVSVWILPEGTAARTLDRHTDTVTHLAASPTSELVASSGRDGCIHVWNFTSGGLVRSFPNTGAPITALAISPDDQVLIGGRSNGELVLWSLSTGKEIAHTQPYTQPVTGLILSPDGEGLYTADNGGHLQVWDLRTFLVVRLPGLVARPGTLAQLQNRLKMPHLSPAEKKWLTFAVELARWRQRFDIELAKPTTIQIGEFDIEL